MDLLPLTLASGWTSGINPAATVLILRRGCRAVRPWLGRRAAGPLPRT